MQPEAVFGVRCGSRAWWRLAAATFAWLAMRSKLMAKLRSVAITRGALPVLDLEQAGDLVTFRVRATASDAACPACRRRSSRVHARYQRRLADLPRGARQVQIIVSVRRFKCANLRCGQSTFSEQIPGLTAPFARRTPPLTGALADVALALAGRPGSRVAARLAMPCCRDVLIRLIRAQPVPGPGHVDVLGVDDFAVRRGQSYNTILINMATHRPVDVLPDREAETLAAWLREHPEVRTVCRDRAGAYAEGIRTGAPQAVQVADRFHLWKNLCEAAGKTVASHHHCLCGAAAASQAEPAVRQAPAPAPLAAAEPAALPGRPSRLAERTRARYAEVQECLARGLSRAAAARELNLDIQTVRRFASATSAEELLGKAEHRSAKLDPYLDLVNQRWNEGVTNAEAITAELRALIMAQRRGPELPAWLDAVEADDLPELRSLAVGMRRDLPAVINGLTLEHSSGAVEGNVTRVKLDSEGEARP